jgi:competence protein ComEC
VVTAVFAALHVSRITNTPGDALARTAGEDVRVASVSGIVTSEPKVDDKDNAVFLLRLHSIKFDTETFTTNATVLAHWRGSVNRGDEVALFGTLEPIAPPRNPGQFNMRSYLARQDVKRSFVVRYPENGRVIESGSSFSILRAATRSRAWMQTALSRDLETSPDVTAFICATSLGQRHQTAEDIEEPFQQSGTLHLFSVSGLHVAIVARLLWTVATMLRLPRKAGAALIIPSLFFYAAVTGLQTASLRAAVMGAILLGGIFFDRKVLALNSLAAAAFLILLWDSNELFRIGFQLSFAVVGAIILLADPIFLRVRQIAAADPFLPPALLSRGRRMFTATVHQIARAGSVSFAAWIGSLPLIYWYFNLITPVALLANLVVVPLAFFVLALAMLSLLAAPISLALSVVFNNTNWLLSRLVLGLVHVFTLVPGGHFYVQRFTESRSHIFITVLDEGIGGAAHLRAYGDDWLIDCGRERSYERILKTFLHSRGVNRLKGILLTHGDAQHIGGAADAARDFRPREIFDNPLEVRSTIQRRLLDTLRANRQTPRHLIRGDHLEFGRDVQAQILYPPIHLDVESADDAPVIARVRIKNQCALLFESDAGAEAEAALVASRDNLRSDILIKGQHHSGGSGTPQFIGAVQPKLIVATSRERPLAENIDESWQSDLTRRGIKLFRQNETGAVEIQFRGGEWTARAFLTGETFRSSNR